jgi:hypothetical protein
MTNSICSPGEDCASIYRQEDDDNILNFFVSETCRGRPYLGEYSYPGEYLTKGVLLVHFVFLFKALTSFCSLKTPLHLLNPNLNGRLPSSTHGLLGEVGFSVAGEENVGDNDGRTGYIGGYRLPVLGIGVEKREDHAPPVQRHSIIFTTLEIDKPLRPRDRPVLFSLGYPSSLSRFLSNPNPHPPPQGSKACMTYARSFSYHVGNP